jgi:transglutaminase-like putative cysteine protease
MANNFPIKHQPSNEFYLSPDDYFWGGTEEMLITKGSDWCGEVARVFCALAQIEGIPTRIVYTYNHKDGHVINESYLSDRWILIDSTNGILYRNADNYFNAADSMINRKTFQNTLNTYSDYYYSNIEYFKYIDISEYILMNSSNYNYRISFCNDYYRNILKNVWNH